MRRDDLPVRDPGTVPDRYERPNASVRGVLLAAETSSRYGAENKLLATLDGTPLVRHVAEGLLESAVVGVTVEIDEAYLDRLEHLDGFSHVVLVRHPQSGHRVPRHRD